MMDNINPTFVWDVLWKYETVRWGYDMGIVKQQT